VFDIPVGSLSLTTTPDDYEGAILTSVTHTEQQATADNGAVFHIVGAHLYAENSHGQVLLGLRHAASTYAAGTWHFLAGHCEQESASACIVREAEEEAGLTIAPDDVELAHVVHLVDKPGDQPRIQLFFRARKWAGSPELREPDRCTAWKWWHPDQLPDRLVPYTRAAIEGIRAGHLFTPMGWP
jgi:8-oxo-dGTP diphosphatase